MSLETIRRKGRRLSSIARDFLFGTNLSSLSLITRPQRMRRYVLESLFLQRSLAPAQLDSKSVADVFGLKEDIRLTSVESADNWLTWGPSFAIDIVNLCLLCRAIQPKIIFEIGTFHGYTTLHLASNSPEDATVYTLDLDPGSNTSLPVSFIDQSVIEQRMNSCLFSGREEATKIRRLYGDSAKFDFSPYAGKVDLFFIDGSHSYEYVKSDTLNALKCCHKGSAIAWHDYGRPEFGVSKYLSELAKELHIHIVPGGSLAFAVI